MLLKISMIFPGLLIVSLSAKAESNLSMQDLKALEKQQAWRELVDKADHVAPAERTPDFNSIVIHGATGLVTQIDGSSGAIKQATETAQEVTSIEKKYAFVTNNAEYTDAKGKALGAVAEACSRGSTYGCGSLIEALSKGVQKFPKGAARKIAVLMGEEGRFPSEVLRFWSLAAEDDKANCQHGTLKRSVIFGLNQDPAAADAKTAVKAAQICAGQLDEGLMEGIRKTEKNSAFARNACPLLKARGKNNMAMRDKCS